MKHKGMSSIEITTHPLLLIYYVENPNIFCLH